MNTLTPILAAASIAIACPLLAGSEFYVAVDGGDNNPGTQAAPWATIQAAVNRLQPGDTLLVHSGVYRETVTFPRSGTAARPITVKASPGEKVVITGCEPVTGWTLHDAAKNIWKAPMPWTLGPGRNQVFANGEVLIEARFPNQAAPGLEMPVAGLSRLWPTFGEFSNPDPVAHPERVVSRLLDGQPGDFWTGALYYGIHYGGWSAQTGVIESSQAGEIRVGDRTRHWWSVANNYAADDGRGMIVGHINALDQPGEWLWQDNTLYLIPPTGVDLTAAAVEAKRRQLAFDLSGREHIQVEGISVHASSARLQDSAYCVFDRCQFEYVSHFTRHYAVGQIEPAGDDIKSGETGIFVGGHDNAFLNCTIRFSAGAGFYLRGCHHTIHNCLIDEVSYTSHYLNAITDAVADFPDYENFLVGGHAITFNTMRNAGRHFFNFYGNGTSTASRTRGPMDYAATLFAHNHLYNGMLQTRDAGFLTGYYSSGGTLNGQNSRVAYNVMHDCYDAFAIEMDVLGIVYLDAGTCDVTLHHNLLWAAPGSLQRSLWFNTACVDIREHDNVFHGQFTRNCAELAPGDFPAGRPFRFGHDFENPPPRPHWPQLARQRIEAESCTDRSAGANRTPTALTGLKDGDWLAFEGVDLGRGWQSAVMRFASDDKAMNADRAARTPPRHRKATDPLVLEVAARSGASPGVGTQWSFCHNVADGAWLKYEQVPVGEGYRRFRAIYGNTSDSPRHLEVRLDRVDGPLVGRVDLPKTDTPRGGAIQVYQEAVGKLAPEATGTRDVYLVFHSEDGKLVGEFEYFRFEQYRGQIPLQANEVKIEVRAGGTHGEKVGEFYPRFTGGAGLFRELVATLEPTELTGPQTLCLVVRSALDRPVGAIDWITLEKGQEPMDLTGLGVEPLKRDGQYIFPEPTHRPLPPDIRRLPARLRQKLESQEK